MKQDHLTKLFQPDTTEAVLHEVLVIAKLISANFNTDSVTDIFNAANRLYKGKYPGYKACNTDYHDFPHVSAVFLAMTRLIHGAVLDNVAFTERQIVLGLAAAILHDAGYIQEESDKGGTGAKYTENHVQRSIDFLSRHGSQYGLSGAEIEAASSMILCTDLAVDITTIGFLDSQTELLGKMLGTADLMAQLADRLYLEKLLYLYHELKEGGIGDYEGEVDVLKNAVGFYQLVAERLKTKLGATDRFMRSHFAARWNVDKNLYHEEIERQKNYLCKILEIPDADPRDYLRRGGIVEKVRRKYRRKKSGPKAKSN
ncbi:MAG: hypothetical protein PVI06_21205 [Desulfobacterales bacterium]|jgi:hypothetical protein